ncbi:MAG TPA: hypothetical protein PKD57_14915 [Saprospiraceae bacterium]|nr:hypothetical protein [Saprospiraceae bacterium]
MGEKLPCIVGLSFEVWRGFLVDTIHVVMNRLGSGKTDGIWD